MKNKQNSAGRPSLTKPQVDIIFRKLEPFLKSGLSLHKACIQAKIPKSTVYDLGRDNQEFAEKIEACINYFSVTVNSIINKELIRISEKQKTKQLNAEDIKFVQWTATNSRSTREEFDRKFITETDKESEEDKKKKAILDNPTVLATLLKVADRVKENLIAKGEYPPAKDINA